MKKADAPSLTGTTRLLHGREASPVEFDMEKYGSHNIYQDAEMAVRFVQTHENISTSRDIVQLHSHSFYEILYCNTGNIRYLLGTLCYQVQPGDIIFIPSGIAHRPLLNELGKEIFARYVLWCSSEFIAQASAYWFDLRKFFKNPFILRTAGTKWAFLSESFRNGCQEAADCGLGWQTWICGNALQILAVLLRAVASFENQKVVPEHDELLENILEYIETHFSEKITLAGVSRRFLTNQSSINQLFRQQMDVSFYHFVTQRRLIAAKNLILDGQPLIHTGEMVGFSDHSTFYRAFKQEYGISPKQFRNLQKENL